MVTSEIVEFNANLQTYWNDTACRLEDSIEAPPEEAWPIDVFEEDGENQEDFARAIFSWCRGFMRATTEWPEAWGDALKRTDLAPHWAILRAWADPEGPGNLKLIQEVGQRESAEMVARPCRSPSSLSTARFERAARASRIEVLPALSARLPAMVQRRRAPCRGPSSAEAFQLSVRSRLISVTSATNSRICTQSNPRASRARSSPMSRSHS